MMHPTLAWLYWNPERTAFTIPFINRPVVWYGLWFVLGFIVGYLILLPMFRYQLQKSRHISNEDSEALRSLNPLAYMLLDRLTWFVVGGTIIGARLGHVFFYDWPRYQNNLGDILKVWEGGLASHGGAVGVLIGLILYQRLIRKNFPEFTFITLLDLIVVPTAFTAFCIRMGNFFNQEILGSPSNVPWAVIFGDPIDGKEIAPRHPVQLYEAAVYLLTFFFLWFLWRKWRDDLKPGVLSGLFFIMVFGARFLIEFLKTPQSLMFKETFLQTGQYLSIPFILWGIILLMKRNSNET